MRFDVITLFPALVEAVAQFGIVQRAIKRNLAEIHYWNPRDYTQNKHRTVDDRPYGGGPGMVMKADCLFATIRDIRQYNQGKLIYLSPQGKVFKQKHAVKMAKDQQLIFLCGRYEGIDERVIQSTVDEEWSIGDYVLSGGELASMVMIDAITRLLPQALGHQESALQDSFMTGFLDHPHYTRPESIEGLTIPTVLKSGNHAKINRWRRQQALGRSYERRPDLLTEQTLSDTDKALLKEYLEVK